ncbi:hypothetical protein XarbCFBP8152_15390 [Xanthomonas arboricola]|nr:hypothetical protein XarbCFBP8152_15390 [Xanthomonas arboricola]
MRSVAWLQGPCPPTVAGPYAAWMPRKSLQGRTCGVSCGGGRAGTLQPGHRSHASTLLLGFAFAFASSKSPGLGPQ